jgi:hypothetical protein
VTTVVLRATIVVDRVGRIAEVPVGTTGVLRVGMSVVGRAGRAVAAQPATIAALRVGMSVVDLVGKIVGRPVGTTGVLRGVMTVGRRVGMTGRRVVMTGLGPSVAGRVGGVRRGRRAGRLLGGMSVALAGVGRSGPAGSLGMIGRPGSRVASGPGRAAMTG